MRPTNIESKRTVVNIPLPLKKELYEAAEKEGLSMTAFIIQILWRWERGQDVRTGK